MRLKRNFKILGNYNSLTDKHLAGYFSNPRIRRHLLRAGLIRQNGDLVSPIDYKACLLEEQRWLASQAFLAQAIVQRALDLEYTRRAHLQRQLEEIIRVELVERVKSARSSSSNYSQKRTSLSAHAVPPNVRKRNHRTRASSALKRPFSAPNFQLSPTGYTLNTNNFINVNNRSTDDSESEVDLEVRDTESRNSAVSTNFQFENNPWSGATLRLVEVETSPYSLPLMPSSNRNGLWRSRSAFTSTNKSRLNKKRISVLTHLLQEASSQGHSTRYSCCNMTLKYFGNKPHICRDVNEGRQEVLIRQQFSGGNPVAVFCQSLQPGSVFTFTSRRYHSFPFSVTIHVDGVLALRLSACCEYKYQVGGKLGGPHGYFTLVSLEGSSPCSKCIEQKGFALPTVSEIQPRQTSVKPRRPMSGVIRKPLKPTHTSRDAFIPSIHQEGETPLMNAVDKGHHFIGPDEIKKQETIKGSVEERPFEKSLESSLSKFQKTTQDIEEEIEEEIQEEILSTPREIHLQTGRVTFKESEPIKELGKADDDESENGSNGTSEVEEEEEECTEEESENNSATTEGTSATQSSCDKQSEEDQPHSENPKIKVTRAQSSSGSGTADDGEEKSQSEEEETSEESSGKSQKNDFLKPEDALKRDTANTKTQSKAITEVTDKKDVKSVNEINSEEAAQSSAFPDSVSHSRDVPFDSSDEEENKASGFVTTVTVDVHVSDERSKNSTSDSKDKSVQLAEESFKEEPNKENKPTSSNNKNENISNVSDCPQDLEQCNKEIESSSQPLVTDRFEIEHKNDEHVVSHQDSYDDDNGSIEAILESPFEIELSGAELNDEQIADLAILVRSRLDLASLVIRKAGLDDVNIIELTEALLDSSCPLKVLNLNLNQLGAAGGRQIAEIIRSKPTLEVLLLHGNPLCDSGLSPIVEALLETNAPDHFSCSKSLHNGITRFDVGDTSFNNEGALSLASLIEHSETLDTLILTGNSQLHGDAWNSIFWGVSQNSSLTTLLVDYCALGDHGVTCMANEIQDHPLLHTIDLEGNGITDHGAQVVLELARHRTQLRELHLEIGNEVSKSLLSEIQREIASHK